MRVRSVFISDVHLGSPECRSDVLLRFLRTVETTHLYLIGDIIDLESLSRRRYWPAAHTEAVRLVLQRVREGGRVVYIPGNHDRNLRARCGSLFGGIEMRRFVVHNTACERSFLLMHGDEFDHVLGRRSFTAEFAAMGYRWAMRANTWINDRRATRGGSYLPLAASIKSRVSGAQRYMQSFQDAVSSTAKALSVDGVICGHIHGPGHRSEGGFEYLNTGDWVENCTAVVEHLDGRMQLICWPKFEKLGSALTALAGTLSSAPDVTPSPAEVAA